MILVVGTVRLADGAMEKLLPSAMKMMEETRKEDGCISYAYSQDLVDPAVMHVSESWRDQEALSAHFETAHMQIWRKAIGEVGLLERNLMAHVADEGVPT